MLNIPAVCSCGLVFPSGIVIGDVTNITLRGNKSQCPRCGRMADIPDAILSSYNGAVEVLQTGNYSQAQILGFFNVLQKTYVQLKSNKSTSLDETIENIEESIPFLAALLPSLNNKSELYTFIGLLLQFFSMFIGNQPQTVNNFNAPVVIINESEQKAPARPSMECIQPIPKKSTGMCACGSGLVSQLCCNNSVKANLKTI